MGVSRDDVVYVGTDQYPLYPGMWDSVKEAFLPQDQRAVLNAHRQVLQTRYQQQTQPTATNDDSSPWTNMQGGSNGQ